MRMEQPAPSIQGPVQPIQPLPDSGYDCNSFYKLRLPDSIFVTVGRILSAVSSQKKAGQGCLISVASTANDKFLEIKLATRRSITS
jgi:hypothetical protein